MSEDPAFVPSHPWVSGRYLSSSSSSAFDIANHANAPVVALTVPTKTSGFLHGWGKLTRVLIVESPPGTAAGQLAVLTLTMPCGGRQLTVTATVPIAGAPQLEPAARS